MKFSHDTSRGVFQVNFSFDVDELGLDRLPLANLI